MNEIAALEIDRSSLLRMSLSRKRLYETRGRENGALNRILGWIKAEDPRGFIPKNVTIGRDDDDFVINYYADGMRYRVLNDGTCLISSADWTKTFDREIAEMSHVIDTILADDLLEFSMSVLGEDDVKFTRARTNDDDNDGLYDEIRVGIAGS